MASDVIRILSDLHYGDRGSRVRLLPSIKPLFEGAGSLVMNGDTIDTRPSHTPEFTAALRAETLAFFTREAPPTTFLTGNHDPEISPEHTLDLAGGAVFVTHGDIIFDDLVPWGQDAPTVRQRIAEELSHLPQGARDDLDARLGVYRRVAAGIPQRHQSERDAIKYFASLLSDTAWPPLRVLRVFSAWRRAPELAATLTRRYRPEAKFVVIGHIHHPGFWRRPNGVTVINTGSFCPPLDAWMVDVHADHLTLRTVRRSRGEFRLGQVKAEFSL